MSRRSHVKRAKVLRRRVMAHVDGLVPVSGAETRWSSWLLRHAGVRALPRRSLPLAHAIRAAYRPRKHKEQ